MKNFNNKTIFTLIFSILLAFGCEDSKERSQWAVSCILFLKELLGDENSKVFVNKLQGLVEADGVVTKSEAAFMEIVNEMMGS